ncbi:putative ferredoxin hydrogenase [Cetobacterium somerae ATCC BAA-474]|uniref:Putative ferredoxin hydrogenase n=2 Tax=Cetobacterium TaxID=180162 RepID=U7V928_9FUSO|nr:2Fe-2S iron-sulfur cluster binding domain-containing protein [Cetobacterium somerae]ERT68055.1 putative ferredoxin hydrogenase [Cetobacterium somerae ATCC BAA-474]
MNFQIEIDGVLTDIESTQTLLEKCKELGINIPTLCHHEDLGSQKVCGICVIECNGELLKSCETYPQENMIIKTKTPKIIEKREKILKDIMENHPNDCLTCEKSKGDCELQNISFEYNIVNRNLVDIRKYEIDNSSSGITRNMNKCILCERCVAICKEVQGLGIYEVIEADGVKEIVIKDGKLLGESKCVSCGQCIKICPVGALTEKNSVTELNRLLKNSQKHIVVQIAPAIKHTIGEEFFITPGVDVTSKMVGALKKLGFDKVFSTDFSADVTIMEEGTELIERLMKGDRELPMFTSCCPGWVNYVEKSYPNFIKNLSSCKSPQQMFGALAKSYYSNTLNIPKEDIYVVSIMPCTAKKGESERIEMQENGIRDVDLVITTREFAKLIKMNNIDFNSLPDDLTYDSFMGLGSSAGRIFGSSGGVMEAALRTVSHILTDGQLKQIEFKTLRGFENVKSAEIILGERKIKVAVINGIGSAKKVLDAIEKNKIYFDFIEVMACYGGCISGGGAPIPDSLEVRKSRMKGMYLFDSNSTLRKSHENIEVINLYKNYLKEPCGHKSHHILHTTYSNKTKI